MSLRILDDLSNFGVSDIASIYALVNKNNIDEGIAATNNLVAQLTAQAQVLSLQRDLSNNPNAQTTGTLTNGISKNLLVAGAVLVVLGAAYFVIKK